MTTAAVLLLCAVGALVGSGSAALVIGWRDDDRVATWWGRYALAVAALVAVLMWGVTW